MTTNYRIDIEAPRLETADASAKAVLERAITRLERIARDLAYVLSPQGEGDWRRYVPMAETVGTRLCQQFDEIMSREGERPGDTSQAA